ncbi:MAG: proline--tRNA ligase [Halanaerobiales bacterium]
MKMSNLYSPTLKETPAEAEVASHKLMLRAGMLRKLSAGVYCYLPLAYRVIKKIEKITREAMDESGAQEVLLPMIQTSDIWKESKRWDKFGPLMVKFRDRKDNEYCLGPTHEEVISDLVRDEVRSYKDLPFNLYQIQTKVRDEIRPRFGLLRTREFIMKDAYSLDRDYEGLDKSYQKMYEAYKKVFDNCGLKTRVVEADTGAMGGKDSQEFMVLADSGEDDIGFCNECDYAANVERAISYFSKTDKEIKEKEIDKVKTPGVTTIEDLTDFLDMSAENMIKTLAIKADGRPILALLRGEDQLNEIKLRNYLGADEIEAVDEENFSSIFDSIAGFIGPVGIDDVSILADRRIKNIVNGVCGANEKDYHYINVNPERDFKVDSYVDLRTVKQGDKCPHCQGTIEIKSGIEVGHIFKLGTKYSDNMNVSYLDENGEEKPVVMGSYGIGITRLVAAAIEQNHDEDGIIWPKEIAPYHVHILPLGQDEKVINQAEILYKKLEERDIEVLLDDREERAGVKFNDADLIGIPLRVVIGSRSLEKGVIEVRVRRSGKEYEFSLSNMTESIIELFSEIK